MSEFFTWILAKVHWLIDLAKPENLLALVESFPGSRWVAYAILAGIVFSETGLLIGFFLPGDSLLFAAGFLASKQIFDIVLLNVVLCAAAVLGDAVNYFFGWRLGADVFEKGRIRFVKQEHLLAAKAFYERHGGIAIVLARFAPFVRTFTPFVAGVARMNFRRFLLYNLCGGIGWVVLMSLSGYFLGQIPWVAAHFELVVLGILVFSVLPVAFGVLRQLAAARAKRSSPPRPLEAPPET
ncbi:MAG TPA: VTT domain-containing protein [Pirellulales bacterium]|jgi:membrane-associated protein|nr:VTT domain-containing protein [Pirellulales bacterium]